MGNIKSKLEYVWLTSYEQHLTSKVKVVSNFSGKLEDCSEWFFNGGATGQATAHMSDCLLKPVRLYKNPMDINSYIVLCEVYTLAADKSYPCRLSNIRYLLRKFMNQFNKEQLSIFDPWFGFEQEYTLYDKDIPIGMENNKSKNIKSEYYLNEVGEEIAYEHLNKCIDSGINIVGINKEGPVMLGQWEYQIGEGDPIKMSDDLWIARWLLQKIAGKYNLWVSLYPNPIDSDDYPDGYGNIGCHTNFSTKNMRVEGGYKIILSAIRKLEQKHKEHMDYYGFDNQNRLTGQCYTSDFKYFTYGVADRYASVRIPWKVFRDKKGYLEDRRPAANCDPYMVSLKILETVCS